MTMSDQDLKQALSQIPTEYQETFRQSLAADLAENEALRTDQEILAYLRRRQEAFRQGAFIRPDGRLDTISLAPEALYERALPQLARRSLAAGLAPDSRRQTILKLGLLAALALLFAFFLARGRSQQVADPALSPTVPALAAVPTTVPTPPLPEITGAEDTLQTIGGLGGALTLGRPSALEIYYSRTGETLALAIDPSRPTARGELRYDEAAMTSENPVAVWLFGTVLNYAIGIPDSLVRNLVPGDAIHLSTDTGASLGFLVTETGQGANYQTGQLLSQDRLGLTLFSLPAPAAEAVSYALASYDARGEAAQEAAASAVGQPLTPGPGAGLMVTGMAYSHTAAGDFRIDVSGTLSGSAPLLSLLAAGQQTSALPLVPDAAGGWQATFTLPDTTAPDGVGGPPLLAEFRSPAGARLALVDLGPLPDLAAGLVIRPERAWWQADSAQAVLSLSLTNPGPGAVYLGPDFIRFQGGDADDTSWQVTPRLPLLLGPGETMGLSISFLPAASAIEVQIGSDLWQVAGFPQTE